MAEEQSGGLWTDLGRGLQAAGEVLSPTVYEKNAIDRREIIPNMVRTLSLVKQKRQLDADAKFSQHVAGLEPSAMNDSATLLDKLKTVPLDVIAESPRAQAALGMAAQMQQREAAAEAKREQIRFQYAQLDQQRELAQERAQDNRLSAEERARHNLAMERIQTALVRMQETAKREGVELRREMFEYRKAQEGGNASLIPPEAEGKTGEELLKAIPPSMAAIVKKVGDYEIDPKSLSTRGGHREKILALASAYNPGYDDKDYAQIKRSIYEFSTGRQGQVTRSLNVAIEHLDTAKRFADALKNKDIQLVNKIANEFATQTGKGAPVSLEAVKEIVADEVVKGVIGGPGALADREAAAAKIKAASSPEQFAAIVSAWTELMGGQLKGLEKQYEGSTRKKDFREKYLTPRARAALESTDQHGGGSAKEVPNKNAKGWALMVDANGNKAYVGPAGEIEEVK